MFARPTLSPLALNLIVLLAAACGDDGNESGDASCFPHADAGIPDAPIGEREDTAGVLDALVVDSVIADARDALVDGTNDGGDAAPDAPPPAPRKICRAADFDGDRKTDFGVWNTKTGQWTLSVQSEAALMAEDASAVFGDKDTIPMPGDFDGSGLSDFGSYGAQGVWRKAPATWSNSVWYAKWGEDGDIPLVFDYDQDGTCDIATWRPSNSRWYILPSSMPGGREILLWGPENAQPVPGDYDGNGRGDAAFFIAEDGVFKILAPGTGKVEAAIGGQAGDVAVSGDFDGDRKHDMVVFRPTTATWMMRLSSKGALESVVFGDEGAIAVEGDFDGDGKADLASWSPSTGVFKARPSKGGATLTTTLGGPGYLPLTAPPYVLVHRAMQP